MTIAEMRTALGLASSVSDSAVEAAWLLHIEAQPAPMEPISVAEAKANTNVVTADEDDAIAGMIVAAREHIESATGLTLTARQFVQYADGFRPRIALETWPVRSVANIDYLDASGATQALDLTAYRLLRGRRPTTLAAAVPGGSYPPTSRAPSCITITLDAGFATPEEVPGALKRAILMLVDHFYQNRSAVEYGTGQASEMPLGVVDLIRPFRLEAL